MCECVCVFTYEARGGRIGLDRLLSVALNHIPELPHVTGVKDVEGLGRVEFPALHIGTKQIIIRTSKPLRKKEGGGGTKATSQFRPVVLRLAVAR